MKEIGIVSLVILSVVLLFSCKNRRGDAEKLYVSAIEYYAKKDLQTALNFVNLACDCNKNFYEAQFLKSKIYFFLKDYEASQKIVTHLVKKHSGHTEARLWLIRCCIMQDNFADAEELLMQELSFNISDWRVYYLYSLLASKKHDMDTQLVMLGRAETALADSQKVYEKLASSWELMGLPEKARGYKVKSAVLFDVHADSLRLKNY